MSCRLLRLACHYPTPSRSPNPWIQPYVSISLMPINIVASQVPRAGTHNVLLNPSLVSTCVCVLDSSLPGSSVHRVFQARILEWVAISSSRGSSQPGDLICVSCIFCTGRWILFHYATWEAPSLPRLIQLVTTYKSFLSPAIALVPIAPASGKAPPAWLLT